MSPAGTETVGATDNEEALHAELQQFVGLDSGPPVVARDPVNIPMIRHWCDAMGDTNPVYTDPEAAAASIHGGIVAPPAMLQAWTMRGLQPGGASTDSRQGEMLAMFDSAGFSSVVATNSDTEYARYLRPGDLVTLSAVVEEISPLKHTALGDGFFITSRQTWRDHDGETVASMRWRILKFRPPAKPTPPAVSATAATATPGTTTPGTATPGTTTPGTATPGTATPGTATQAGTMPWPHPAVNRDSAFFWEGTLAGELRIQHCTACGTLRHPPGPACPHCGSYEWDYQVATGRGTIFSFVVHHHPQVPPHTTPFVVVLVDLEEGTRIVGNLIDVDPTIVAIDLPVRVSFEQVDSDLVLPQWRLETT